MKRVVASPFIGELGHELLFWQAHLRWFKHTKFKDHEFEVVCWPGHEILYEFASKITTIPTELCSEEVLQHQSTNTLHLLAEGDDSEIDRWFASSVDLNGAEVIRSKMISTMKYRHGYHDLMGNRHYQVFTLLQASEKGNAQALHIVPHELWRYGKYVVVYPRYKPGRFATRNWDYWKLLVEFIREELQTVVVVAGVKGLTEKEFEGTPYNAILPSDNTDLDLQIALLNNAAYCVTPVSGCTFLSLLAGCPTVMVGTERLLHHLKYRNIFQTKTLYFHGDGEVDIMPKKKDLNGFWLRLQKFHESCMDERFSL